MKMLQRGMVNHPIAESAQASFYELSDPAALVFETVHPGDELRAMTYCHLYPDGIMNSTITREEAEGMLRGRGLHQHDYFELAYVIHGEMIQNIENRRHLYREGSLCLLNRRTRHAEEFSTDFETLFAEISVPLMEKILRSAKKSVFSCEKALLETPLQDFLIRDDGRTDVREYMDFIPKKKEPGTYVLLENITRLFLDPRPGVSFLLAGYLSELFYHLADARLYETRPVMLGTKKENQVFDRADEILHSTHGRITRAQLAKRLSYSGDYIGRVVRAQTGLSLFDYSMTICMKYAAHLLRSTDLSVAQIAEELHFSNRKHFYDIFEKNFGMTPAEYRKKFPDMT